MEKCPECSGNSGMSNLARMEGSLFRVEKAGEVAWNSGGPYTIRPRIQCSMKSPKGSEEVTK